MKIRILINGVIILMAGPLMVAVLRMLDVKVSVSKLLLAGYFPNPGLFISSILQTLVLLGPVLLFLTLTIFTMLKAKYRTSIIMSCMTSLSWAHMMYWSVFCQFWTGP